jgi:hypothetical protein
MVDFLRFFRLKAPTASVEQSELHIYRSRGNKRIAIVTLFDVPRSSHDEIIEKIGETFIAFDKIVYVTDIPEFLHFRAAGAAFEYFPSLQQQALHRGGLDWPRYGRVRWELLLAKWQPEHVLAYGLNIDRFLDAAPIFANGPAT